MTTAAILARILATLPKPADRAMAEQGHGAAADFHTSLALVIGSAQDIADAERELAATPDSEEWKSVRDTAQELHQEALQRAGDALSRMPFIWSVALEVVFAVQNGRAYTPPMYVIWCVERSQWWRPGQHGYTSKITEAGRYTLDTAARICERANQGPNGPHEYMLIAPEGAL